MEGKQFILLEDVLTGRAKTRNMSINIKVTFPSFEIRDNGTYLNDAIRQALVGCIENEADCSDAFDIAMLHVPNAIKVEIEY